MIDLGKWPTLRVLGEHVTPDQAGDILICTMPWFITFPKDDGWEHRARKIGAEYGMPLQPGYVHGEDHGEWFRETWHVWRPKFDDWRRKYGVLEVMSEDGPANNLITNTHRAWVNWEGLLAGNFSIGKWPDQDNVAEFFTEVAERFPYLDLTADLISEHADRRGGTPDTSTYSRAYRIMVKRGQVEVHEGDVEPLVLPDEFFEWSNGVDWFDDQGVHADRLRQAFGHLTG